jgi:orotate phosphoribosyltransferase
MNETTERASLAQRIFELCKQLGALSFGKFTLSSGLESSYYFDGRLLTLSPEGATVVAQSLLPLVRASGADAVGGPTLGADPMVASIALLSYQDNGVAIPAFIVRKGSKDHGMGKLIEGPLPPKAKVAIVDDACSVGGSLLHAVRAAEEAGCEVVLVAAILDRHQGGSKQFLTEGYNFTAILEADDDGNIAPTAKFS